MQVSSIGINRNGSNDISFKSGINAELAITAAQKSISPRLLKLNTETNVLISDLLDAPMKEKPGIRLKIANLALKLARVNKY